MADLRFRAIPVFPSRVEGESLITVETQNGVTTIGYDDTRLISTTSIPDPSKFETVIRNKETGVLTRGGLNLFGGGTTTSTSVVTGNGFAGSVSNPSTTPAITLSTTVNGLVKGNGTALMAATAGTDYQLPISPAALTRTNDTNVTLTLGGTPNTALLQATSLTLGWTGTLAAARLNSSVVQAITNDTNVTGSISAQTLTLGWTGTLAAARLNSNVVQSVTNDTNVTGSISAQALTIGWSGTLAVSRGGTGGGSASAARTNLGLAIGSDVQAYNANLTTTAANSVLGNNTGTGAAPISLTPSQILDILGSVQGSILYRGASGWVPLSPGTSGQVLQSGGAAANPSWLTVTGTGTVTSVALSLTGGIFTVSGSPVTGSGTLTGTLANQSANNFLAGPTTGSATTPTFRTLVAADLNGIGSNWGDILFRGTAGWTTLAPGSSGQVLRTNGTGSDPSWVTVSGTGTVTSVSIVSANGFAGSVATATTTPAITISTSITGLLKGNGTAISAATDGTDFVSPSTLASTAHAFTAKTTPVAADEVMVMDSAASFAGKRSTFSNIIAAFKATASAVWVGTSDILFVTAKNIADSHAWYTLTGSTPTWDSNNGYNARQVLAANLSVPAITNPVDGRTYVFLGIQPASGGPYTWTVNSMWDFGGAGAPTASTTANARDLLTGIYDATTGKLIANFRKGT